MAEKYVSVLVKGVDIRARQSAHDASPIPGEDNSCCRRSESRRVVSPVECIDGEGIEFRPRELYTTAVGSYRQSHNHCKLSSNGAVMADCNTFPELAEGLGSTLRYAPCTNMGAVPMNIPNICSWRSVNRLIPRVILPVLFSLEKDPRSLCLYPCRCD